MNTLSNLNLEDIKATTYVESLMGPMRPGLHFYRWLMKGPSLQLPLAEVMLSDDNYMRYICNDAEGNVISRKAVHDDINAKATLLTDFITACVKKSERPEGLRVVPSMLNDPLLQRIVAVRKTPQWKHVVGNRVEVLLPYPAQAAANTLMDTRNTEEVLQRYVRVKSRNANVFRIFWKMKPGTKSVVNGYTITGRSEITRLKDERLRRASYMMASQVGDRAPDHTIPYLSVPIHLPISLLLIIAVAYTFLDTPSNTTIYIAP